MAKLPYKSPYTDLSEGIHDPAIFKAVLLAGASGAGKDFILSQCISGLGLREINSDSAFEFLMKKNNFSMVMDKPSVERDILRGRAKHITKDKERLTLGGRMGIIINRTADNASEVQDSKNRLEAMGYQCFMVFVNVPNEVSRARNISRGHQGGRTVPEIIRSKIWLDAQSQMHIYAHMFGNNFLEIDNSTDLTKNDQAAQLGKARLLQAFKRIKAFINTPVNNSAAAEWISLQKASRGITEEVAADPFTLAINSDELMESRLSFDTYRSLSNVH